MVTDSVQGPRANALKTLVDTIVSPTEAFEAIRTTPTWGLALAVAIVLSAISSFLMIPALQHAMLAGYPAMIAHNPQLAQLTAAQQKMQLGIIEKTMQFGWIFVIIGIPFSVLISAAIMTLFNALGKGEGSFGKFWAAAANISVPAAGLASIVALVIILARGATSFSTMQSVQGAMPSLALLAPGAGPKLAAFLGGFTPFSIWGAGLVILAMLAIGRVPRMQAWLTGIIILVIAPLFALAFAH